VPGRELLLYQPGRRRGTWNEQMVPGEYAVHYSNFAGRSVYSEPYCTVFEGLANATAYAEGQVLIQPDLRCTIYDHEGFGKPPIEDIRGVAFREKDGLFSEIPALGRFDTFLRWPHLDRDRLEYGLCSLMAGDDWHPTYHPRNGTPGDGGRDHL
jgi:hypothetical protein